MSKLPYIKLTYLQLLKLIGVILLVSTLSCLFLTSIALAHSPLSPDANESLARATFISDPTKSWAIYGELHEGREAQYYRFDITEGQKIHIMLLKSTRPEERDFKPGFVLMGLGINKQGVVPGYVEAPSGANAIAVEGIQPIEATYEPFSPSTFHLLAELELETPSAGTYYVAVHDPLRGGHYGLAIGDRESYTLTEWILIPINLISVYQWEDQNLGFILAPIIATLVIGIGLIISQRKGGATPLTLFDWLGALAGLLFLGTGVATIMQMVLSLIQVTLTAEMVITLGLALIPIFLGFVTLRLSLRAKGRVDLRMRIYFAILGVAALFTWAGLLIGPTLPIIASLLPSRLIASPQNRTLKQK